AGEVASVEDGLPDDRDPGRAAGNHGVIACAEAKVLPAQLRQGSVPPAVGDRLAARDLVGNVGDSGNSSEPRLHIDAVRGGANEETALPRGGNPAALRFGGRMLSRNSRGRG
ncbi:MAG: M23 family peptidase, partial [Gammaproteobacteria bacterium]|nr:M23 family peptidase [Gammaproteobacteria bacterium]